MTRRGFVLGALLTLAAPAWAAPTAAATGPGSVNGIVTRAPSGIGLPHVSVTLRSQTDPTLQLRSSDRLGGFTFDDVPAGLYTLEASRPGWERVTLTPILVFPGKQTVEHVVMSRSDTRRPAT